MLNSVKFTSQFSGIEENLRSVLLNEGIKLGVLKSGASDKEIFQLVESLIEHQNEVKENYQLRRERAKLAIKKALNSGLIKDNEVENYTKLATSSFDTTMKVIRDRKSNETELNNLVKLNGKELWMQGKLERLQELSPYLFKLKCEEISSGESFNQSEKSFTTTCQNPESELQTLLSLTAKELYMQGKLERLKELDVSQFKLKYKEFFNVEYPF